MCGGADIGDGGAEEDGEEEDARKQEKLWKLGHGRGHQLACKRAVKDQRENILFWTTGCSTTPSFFTRSWVVVEVRF